MPLTYLRELQEGWWIWKFETQSLIPGIKTRKIGQWILGKEYSMVYAWCWQVPLWLIGKCWPLKDTQNLEFGGKWRVNPVKRVFLQKATVSCDDRKKALWPYESHEPHLGSTHSPPHLGSTHSPPRLGSPHCPLPPWLQLYCLRITLNPMHLSQVATSPQDPIPDHSL